MKGEVSTGNENVDPKAFQPKDMKTLDQPMQGMLKVQGRERV